MAPGRNGGRLVQTPYPATSARYQIPSALNLGFSAIAANSEVDTRLPNQKLSHPSEPRPDHNLSPLFPNLSCRFISVQFMTNISCRALDEMSERKGEKNIRKKDSGFRKVPGSRAGSDGRRNTCFEFTRWSLKA